MSQNKSNTKAPAKKGLVSWISEFAGEKKDISFGSQIRSYVFCPYTMVKDHRTKYSVGNIQGVMDGDLDEFMNAYLVAKWKGLPMDGSGDDDEEV